MMPKNTKEEIEVGSTWVFIKSPRFGFPVKRCETTCLILGIVNCLPNKYDRGQERQAIKMLCGGNVETMEREYFLRYARRISS